jgi:hypothetical protein
MTVSAALRSDAELARPVAEDDIARAEDVVQDSGNPRGGGEDGAKRPAERVNGARGECLCGAEAEQRREEDVGDFEFGALVEQARDASFEN